MQELLSAIVIFLSVHFGLPAAHHHPRVEFVSAVVLSDLRYNAMRADRRADVSAVYDAARGAELPRMVRNMLRLEHLKRIAIPAQPLQMFREPEQSRLPHDQSSRSDPPGESESRAER